MLTYRSYTSNILTVKASLNEFELIKLSCLNQLILRMSLILCVLHQAEEVLYRVQLWAVGYVEHQLQVVIFTEIFYSLALFSCQGRALSCHLRFLLSSQQGMLRMFQCSLTSHGLHNIRELLRQKLRLSQHRYLPQSFAQVSLYAALSHCTPCSGRCCM